MTLFLQRGFWMAVGSLALRLAPAAAADTYREGQMSLVWLQDDGQGFSGIPDSPPGALSLPVSVRLGSQPSAYRPDGLLLRGELELEGPDGMRTAVLLLDVDLSRASANFPTILPRSALAIEYVEKRGIEVLFQGALTDAVVTIEDLGSRSGLLQGTFSLVLAGAAGFSGARALVKGLFAAVAIPAPEVDLGALPVSPSHHHPNDDYDDVDGEVVVVSSCESDGYVEDDSEPGCGGQEDAQESGCEGDSPDSSDSQGCEGDSASSSSAGCAGSQSGCEGDSAATQTRLPHQQASFFHGLGRMSPELTVGVFLLLLKRLQSRSKI